MPTKPDDIKDTWQYSRSEAAEVLGCSPNTITNRVRAGVLPIHHRSLSRQDTYYLGRDLKAYLNGDIGRHRGKGKRASPREG